MGALPNPFSSHGPAGVATSTIAAAPHILASPGTPPDPAVLLSKKKNGGNQSLLGPSLLGEASTTYKTLLGS